MSGLRQKCWSTRIKALRQFVAVAVALGYPHRGERGNGAPDGPATEPDPEIGEEPQGWTWHAAIPIYDAADPITPYGMAGEAARLGPLHGIVAPLPGGLGDETIDFSGHVAWDYVPESAPGANDATGHGPVALRRVASIIAELVG